jgi:hypothetical protein
MAGSIGRSISIGLSANTKNFAKSLRSAEKNLERFKNGVRVVSTAVAASFTAMGAAAIFFGKNAVEAAIEDDKAQKQLAKTIKNNTKSQKDLTKAAEKTIEALQFQFNIADDKLRPAMAKLVTATKSVSKSQTLMRLALDVSAGTGKSLDSVVGALSKAYLGNKTSLGKLGVGIDKAKLKTMSFDQITKNLSTTFSGQAKSASDTYAGSVEGLRIAWSEFQESVGYKILPKLKGMLNYIKNDLLPFLGEVRDGFTGTQQETISPKLRAVGKAMGYEPGKSAAYTLGESLKTMAESFEKLFTSLADPKGKDGASTLDTIAGAMTTFANAITSITNAVRGAKEWWDTPGFWQTGDISLFGRNFDVTPWDNGASGPDGRRAMGGPVSRNRPYLVGERGPELFVPSGSGAIRSNRQTMGGGSTVINLNGIVDAESARRSIEQLMRRSSLRTGTVNLNGSIF